MSSFSISAALNTSIPKLRVVDVGASMVEGVDHYAPLVHSGLCSVTGFEPDPTQFKALQDSGREHYSYLPYALGDGEPGRFHVARFPGCSSLLVPNRTFIDKFTSIGATPPHGNFSIESTVPMQTKRLDDIQDLGAIDYMKMDIQGVELTVLQHGQRALKDVLVLESEVLFVPLYEGQGDFAELTMFLKQQGFMLLELRDVRTCKIAPFLHSTAPSAHGGQWMWADAIYVRSYEDLSTWDTQGLLKAAVVLHEVYQAYDLVHHLLAEHQLRTMVPTAKRYRAALNAMIARSRSAAQAQSMGNKAAEPA